jgi:membrane-bound lytic murein transglycosylase B
MTHFNYLSNITKLVLTLNSKPNSYRELNLISSKASTPARLLHAPFAGAQWLRTSLSVLLLLVTFQVGALDLSEHPKLQAVADQLVEEKYYTPKQLDKIFSRVEFQQSVLDAMQNPAEYKFTWGKYRKLFLQPDRIEQGVLFWQH